MTEEDRAKVLDVLDSSRDGVLSAIAAAKEEHVHSRPAPGCWTIAEIAEHIAVSEQSVLQLIQDRISRTSANAALRSKIRWSDEELLQRVGTATGKAMAPERLRPTNRFSKIEDAAAAFSQTRALTIAYAASTADELRDRVFPHPAFGPIDGVQWLLFQAAHAFRHAHQIRANVRSLSEAAPR